MARTEIGQLGQKERKTILRRKRVNRRHQRRILFERLARPCGKIIAAADGGDGVVIALLEPAKRRGAVSLEVLCTRKIPTAIQIFNHVQKNIIIEDLTEWESSRP